MKLKLYVFVHRVYIIIYDYVQFINVLINKLEIDTVN